MRIVVVVYVRKGRALRVGCHGQPAVNGIQEAESAVVTLWRYEGKQASDAVPNGPLPQSSTRPVEEVIDMAFAPKGDKSRLESPVMAQKGTANSMIDTGSVKWRMARAAGLFTKASGLW